MTDLALLSVNNSPFCVVLSLLFLLVMPEDVKNVNIFVINPRSRKMQSSYRKQKPRSPVIHWIWSFSTGSPAPEPVSLMRAKVAIQEQGIVR